jgi:hypothetical protein
VPKPSDAPVVVLVEFAGDPAVEFYPGVPTTGLVELPADEADRLLAAGVVKRAGAKAPVVAPAEPVVVPAEPAEEI